MGKYWKLRYAAGAALLAVAACAPGLSNLKGNVLDQIERNKRIQQHCTGITGDGSLTTGVFASTDAGATRRMASSMTGRTCTSGENGVTPFTPWVEVCEDLTHLRCCLDRIRTGGTCELSACGSVADLHAVGEMFGSLDRPAIDEKCCTPEAVHQYCLTGKPPTLSPRSVSCESMSKFVPSGVRRPTTAAPIAGALDAAATDAGAAKSQRPIQLLEAIEDAARRLAEFTSHWEVAANYLEIYSDSLGAGNLLERYSVCAEHEARGEPCDESFVRGVPVAISWLRDSASCAGDIANTIAADRRSLLTATRNVGLALYHAPSELYTSCYADVPRQVNFVARDLLALGGMARDGARALERIGNTVTDFEGLSPREIGATIVEAEADRVLDLLLLSTIDSVERVERQIEKMDRYGIATGVLSLGLETRVVEVATCEIGKEVKAAIDEGKLHHASLGARLCRIGLGRASHSQTQSMILPRVFDGLIAGFSGLPSCDAALRAVPPDIDDPTEREPCASRTPTLPTCWKGFSAACSNLNDRQICTVDAEGRGQTPAWLDREGSPVTAQLDIWPSRVFFGANAEAGDKKAAEAGKRDRLQRHAQELALVRATWLARLQAADSVISGTRSATDLSESSMPLLGEIDPRMAALFMAVDSREGSFLWRRHGDGYQSRLETFLFARDLVLGTPYARDPIVFATMCRNQLTAAARFAAPGANINWGFLGVSAECANATAVATTASGTDMSGVEATIRSAAKQLCETNARLDAKARAAALCAELSDVVNMVPVAGEAFRGAKGEDTNGLLCLPAGYDAIVAFPALRFSALRFLSPSPGSRAVQKNCPDNSAQDRYAFDACSRQKLRARVGAAAASLHHNLHARDGLRGYTLRFQGRASEEEVTDADFLYFAIRTEMQRATSQQDEDLRKALLKRKNEAPPDAKWDRLKECLEPGKECAVDAAAWPIEDVLSRGSTLPLDPPRLPRGIQLGKQTWVRDTVIDGLAHNESFSDVSNRVLSSLRALGLAEVMLLYAPDLCENGVECVIEAYGTSLSPIADGRHTKPADGHAPWRSASLRISPPESALRCEPANRGGGK